MHEVLKGQTLYSIARAYRVTILDIDRENAISAGGLQAGQILRIPAASSLVIQEEVLPQAGTATDKPAATAQPKNALPAAEKPKPAEAQQTRAQEAATGLKSQQETTPRADAAPATTVPARQAEATAPATQPSRQAEAATPATTPAREPAAKPAPPEKKKIHKVQKGESLADIAKKYDITLQELKQANKGVIFAMPDMRLVIPVKGDQDKQ